MPEGFVELLADFLSLGLLLLGLALGSLELLDLRVSLLAELLALGEIHVALPGFLDCTPLESRWYSMDRCD